MFAPLKLTQSDYAIAGVDIATQLSGN